MGYRKAKIEQIARERFLGSRVFPQARNAYQLLFSRDKYSRRKMMNRFYAEFIRPNDLVFDVGANVGVYAETFTELGARVIAVEPNPACCDVLKNLAKRADVIVEACAAGCESGTVLLQLNDNSQLSSANPSWREQLDRSPLHRSARWQRQITVSVTTLDALVRRHGLPKFVKIDVEGFDDEVLRGMTFKPRVLTFEFNRLLPAIAERCLRLPILANDYEFNFVRDTEMKCVAAPWLPRSKFVDRLDELAGREPSGDIIARLAIGR